jgi:hypothetical protein|tara:strand:- start:749 stop:970 length:222 start_codon:yes stop_codon:yes gene_type:complete
MHCDSLLTIIGLSLDIIGVIILFIYGIPPKKILQNQVILEDQGGKEKCYRTISNMGLLLIITGFFLQLLEEII